MKKFLSFALVLTALVACYTKSDRHSVTTPVSQEIRDYYTEWDRAVRIDADMQNMYLNAPRKIEKPIDMYMAMAWALKYNFTRRMVSYEEVLVQAGRCNANKIPQLMENAGYINDTNSEQLSPDLKVAWNVLDVSTFYLQSNDKAFRKNLAFEQSRKVIHNILQETRVLYWKSLTAQRLIPVIDAMTEVLTTEVDKINAQNKKDNKQTTSRKTLIKKRKYMEAIKNLANLRRRFEGASSNLASIMGFHPATEFTLVGAQYGNFELPNMDIDLNHLEWLALSDRPELHVQDMVATNADKELIIRNFTTETQANYESNPEACGKRWSQQGLDTGLAVMEEVRNASVKNLETLRRQRLTSLILNQVYVAWAQYMASSEDYRINLEISDASENIAEDYTLTLGAKDETSQLEAARAIEDEVKTFLSYVDVQESLGNLYATIGLDALPYYMLEGKPSEIAIYLHKTLNKWTGGELSPDDRPYLLDIQSKKQPFNMSEVKLPDVYAKTGEPVNIVLPKKTFEHPGFNGKVKTYAGLSDDRSLPDWLTYEDSSRSFNGTPQRKDIGVSKIKIYGVDKKGHVGYARFDLTVTESYISVMQVPGQTIDSHADILRRCVSDDCEKEKKEKLEKVYITRDIENRLNSDKNYITYHNPRHSK